MDAETFNCPNCNTEIHIAEVRDTDAAVCPNCGHGYRLDYDDIMENYRLVPEEPPQYPMDIDTDRV
jgi:Zn-finger nucleic acid-binding protein